jgi:hypothetical protein
MLLRVRGQKLCQRDVPNRGGQTQRWQLACTAVSVFDAVSVGHRNARLKTLRRCFEPERLGSMTVTEAVNAPRIHHQWLPDEVGYERFGLSADTIAKLQGMGHKVEPMPYGNQIAAILVGAPAIVRTRLGQTLYGAIDPRLNLGDVEGY